jgi:biotin carboxyl carrier protein
MDEFKKFVLDETTYETRLTRKFDRRRPWMPKNPKRLEAQIPGVIHSVQVKVGDAVRRGDPILILEAMKMKNAVRSPLDGRIRDVLVQPGQMVPKGHLMVEFE